MSTSHHYEIEIAGRAAGRVLRPLIDDFTVEWTDAGTTRCVGPVRDPSHLHGLLAHFAALNVVVVGLRRIDPDTTTTTHRHHSHRKEPAMTTDVTPPSSVDRDRSTRLSRIGGAAALAAAGTFVYGIVLFATTMADYTDPDATPAESVDFVVDHQGSLVAWYIGIFIVFGAAVVPLALALRAQFADRTPILADAAAVFAFVWTGLMFATGMVSNIGVEAVADLAETDRAAAIDLWSSIDTVTNGLGGGNELVGGAWILLVSLAGLIARRLPRWLHVVGLATAVAGVLTVVPAFEAIEMVFGLGSIVWFVGVGVALIRDAGRERVEAVAS